MGIITRMRAKLQSLATLTRLDPKYHDEKTAQSVCLLSFVLLLPYLSRPDANILLSTAGLAYSGLVLPMIITVNYKFPIAALKYITSLIVGTLKAWWRPVKYILLGAYWHLDKCERVYMKMKNISVLVSQVVLEWTKAVTFSITVVFMLLVFCLEQGLQNYSPTGSYLIVTGLYYCTTEKVFTEQFPFFLSLFQIDALENMEALWAPVVLKATTMLIAFALALPVLFQGQVRLALLALYVGVWIKSRDLHLHDIPTLKKEHGIIMKYRPATKEELEAHDDVCAVCLWQMRSGRVTPCHHMFHGDCLRRCLHASDLCPFCKRLLKAE